MKKFIYIVLLMLTVMILSCTKDQNSGNEIIDIDASDKYFIEIKNEQYIKRINKRDDINKIFRFINSISLNNNKNEIDKVKTNIESKYRIIIKNDENKVINFISVLDDKLYHNGKWYSIDKKYISRLKDIHEELNYEKRIDKDLTIVKNIKDARENMYISKALIGKWKDNNGSVIRFTKEYLILGKDVYKYIINTKNKTKMYINVYGEKGMFSKNNHLFDLYIEMDDSRCNIIMKKKLFNYMGDDIEYNYDLVYLYKNDENEYLIGEFDSYFFYNKNQ